MEVTQASRGTSKTDDGPIGDLLNLLTTDQAEKAWKEFLERFSPLILHVARRHESDEERASDCFLYACGQLSDNVFHRLRSFRPDGRAQFRTWLTSVVNNLCIDWRRKQHGRYRPRAAVASLPELDQLVYRYIYVRGMTREQCLHVLLPRFPGLTDLQLAGINARLFSMQTSRQRWQIGARARGSISLDEALDPEQGDVPIQPEDPSAGPEALTQSDQERTQLEAAMAKLQPRQRLLLRL
ncbi:MAG: sigma-70 family RNA polymerase sigma factor, partial [Steroidobacteraceae bacterium]|nr:sigma-70 family RNA polymerase sigma factor [Steroidobacteraceae bacterium]